MKLAAKITIVFIALMAIVTLAVGMVAARLEWKFFRVEHEVVAQTISKDAGKLLGDAWRSQGDSGLANAVDQLVARSEFCQIEWVWFDSGNSMEDRPAPNIKKLTMGRVETVVGRSNDGSRRIHTYVPLIDENSKLGGLDVSDSMSDLDTRMRRIWLTSFGAIGSMFLLSVILISLVGTRLVGRPLEKLIDKTKRTAEGDFSNPLVIGGNDEISGLANALNQMCEQLRSQRSQIETQTEARIAALGQLRHADRLQTIGQLASGIAHELGTPLNVIQGHAELIGSQKLPPEEVVDSAKTIKDEVSRMTNIVRQLLNFARRKTGLHETIDLNKLLRDTIEILHSVAHPNGVNLLFESTVREASLDCDPEQIRQVFINLLMNAIQAMPEGGNVNVSIDISDSPQTSGHDPSAQSDRPHWYRVRIVDTGMGIEDSKLEKVFEPFFTTKQPGEGTGLGLSIANGIVQEHNGNIQIKSRHGEGAVFDVYLPRTTPETTDQVQ